MANSYKLSFSGQEIDEKLGNVENHEERITELEERINNKLDREVTVTTDRPGGVYVMTDKGEPHFVRYTIQPVKNTIAMRDAYGRVRVEKPQYDNEAANKEYVRDCIDYFQQSLERGEINIPNSGGSVEDYRYTAYLYFDDDGNYWCDDNASTLYEKIYEGYNVMLVVEGWGDTTMKPVYAAEDGICFMSCSDDAFLSVYWIWEDGSVQQNEYPIVRYDDSGCLDTNWPEETYHAANKEYVDYKSILKHTVHAWEEDATDGYIKTTADFNEFREKIRDLFEPIFLVVDLANGNVRQFSDAIYCMSDDSICFGDYYNWKADDAQYMYEV